MAAGIGAAAWLLTIYLGYESITGSWTCSGEPGLGAEERRRLDPASARALFRDGLRTQTSGWCTGWTQANLIAVPRDLAYDVLLFAQRNPKPCPVLDVGEAGEVSTSIFDGDLRTDLPALRASTSTASRSPR